MTNMVINPKTNEIMSEEMAMSVQGWEEIEFITVENCEEVESENGFVLVGTVNGASFRSVLSVDEYFEGKHFTYEASAANVVNFEAKKEQKRVEVVAADMPEGAFVKFDNMFKRYKVYIENEYVLAFRMAGPGTYLIFPRSKFYRNMPVHEGGPKEIAEMFRRYASIKEAE